MKNIYYFLICVLLFISSSVLNAQTDSTEQFLQADSTLQIIQVDQPGTGVISINHISTNGYIGIGTNNPSCPLEVIGNSLFSGKVEIDSNVSMNGRLDIDGKTVIRDDLEVEGNTWLKKDLTVDSLSMFNDTAYFSKPPYFKNLLDNEHPFIDENEGVSLIYNVDGAIMPVPCDEQGTNLAQWVYGNGIIYDKQCSGNPRIGIGTKTPIYDLDVRGLQYISEGLSIGDGISNIMWDKLIVRTNSTDRTAAKFYYSDENITQNIIFVPKPSTANNPLVVNGDIGIFWSNHHPGSGYNYSSGLVIGPYDTDRKGIKIASNGNVGICTGTIPNDTRLVIEAPSTSTGNFIKFIDTENQHVQLLVDKTGKLTTKEVVVTLDFPLSDFVFNPEYKLLNIYELEQYIRRYNHLPEVPTAADVEKKGLNLGEMDNVLLKKIEELTLYIIDQQKEIDSMKYRLNKLEH